jgi:hypothetical protein
MISFLRQSGCTQLQAGPKRSASSTRRAASNASKSDVLNMPSSSKSAARSQYLALVVDIWSICARLKIMKSSKFQTPRTPERGTPPGSQQPFMMRQSMRLGTKTAGPAGMDAMY